MADDAWQVRLTALERMLDEREERNKERFAAMEKFMTGVLAASDKAIIKAETATEKRFESVNEFRAALQDQTSTLVPRSEYNVHHKALLDTITVLADRLNILERTIIPRAEYEALHKSLQSVVQGNIDRITAIAAQQEAKKQGLSLVGQIVLGVIAAVAATAAAGSAFFRH